MGAGLWAMGKTFEPIAYCLSPIVCLPIGSSQVDCVEGFRYKRAFPMAPSQNSVRSVVW